MTRKIFLSIGTPYNLQQEKIFESIRSRLKSKGLEPFQPKFSSKAPLLNVREALDQCFGIVTVAYPRYWIQNGKEKPGGDAEKLIENTNLTI
jgi:hypothetical protein